MFFSNSVGAPCAGVGGRPSASLSVTITTYVSEPRFGMTCRKAAWEITLHTGLVAGWD